MKNIIFLNFILFLTFQSSKDGIIQQKQTITEDQKNALTNIFNMIEFSFLKDHKLEVTGYHGVQNDITHIKIKDGYITVCEINGQIEELLNCQAYESCVGQLKKCSRLYDRFYSDEETEQDQNETLSSSLPLDIMKLPSFEKQSVQKETSVPDVKKAEKKFIIDEKKRQQKQLERKQKQNKSIDYYGIDKLFKTVSSTDFERETEQSNDKSPSIEQNEKSEEEPFAKPEPVEVKETHTVNQEWRDCSKDDINEYRIQTHVFMISGPLKYLPFYNENIKDCRINNHNTHYQAIIQKLGKLCVFNIASKGGIWFIEDHRINEQRDFLIPGEKFSPEVQCLDSYGYETLLSTL